MDLDGEDVGAGGEGAGGGQGDGVDLGLGGVVDAGQGAGGGGDGAGGHVGAGEFGAVEVDDGAVVASDAQDEVGDGVGAGDGEGVSGVDGDGAVGRVGAAGDAGGDGVAVAEWCGADGPGGVVVGEGAPGGAEVGAPVVEPPGSAEAHRRDRHGAGGHRGRRRGAGRGARGRGDRWRGRAERTRDLVGATTPVGAPLRAQVHARVIGGERHPAPLGGVVADDAQERRHLAVGTPHRQDAHLHVAAVLAHVDVAGGGVDREVVDRVERGARCDRRVVEHPQLLVVEAELPHPPVELGGHEQRAALDPEALTPGEGRGGRLAIRACG